MRWNQIAENTYCNSEKYNPIYDPIQLQVELQNIIPWIDAHVIQPNLFLFAKMLKINSQRSNIPLQHQQTVGDEMNQRGLKINCFVSKTANLESVILEIRFSYIFDYTSTKKFKKSDEHMINGHLSSYIRDLENNKKLFTRRGKLFHFTFHDISNRNPIEKYKAAFHLIVDSMKVRDVIPYRPFIVDHTTRHFVSFDAFDSSLNNIYTTDDTTLELEEMKPFLLSNTSIPLVYNVNGTNINYIDSVIEPIYNKIVEDVLDPISDVKLQTISFPIPELYQPDGTIVKCKNLPLFDALASDDALPSDDASSPDPSGCVTTTSPTGGRKRRFYTKKIRNKHKRTRKSYT
jgi:hypothetical protein